MRFSEDMILCFECLCLAKNYLRMPFVTNIHRINQNSASKKVISLEASVNHCLDAMTKGARLIDDFTSVLEFFKQNPDVRQEVLKFFIDKHFDMIKNLFQGLEPHEVQKIFYDELQNSQLDSKGKNLVAAYLYRERALTR